VGEEGLAHPQDVRQLVAGFRRLSADQLKQLLAGGTGPGSRPEAAEQLVEGTLWVVLQAAEAHKSETLPLEDLFQEGSTALVTVVHGLDSSRPLSPEQFLNRVRQAVGQVMDSLMVEEEEARLEDLRWAADAEKLFAAEAELRLNSASAPTDLQLAAQLSWPVARVAQLRRAVDEARSQHDVELMDIIGEIEGP
jgi:DNA-directed RNA polymerase specialized sigma subunit